MIIITFFFVKNQNNGFKSVKPNKIMVTSLLWMALLLMFSLLSSNCYLYEQRSQLIIFLSCLCFAVIILVPKFNSVVSLFQLISEQCQKGITCKILLSRFKIHFYFFSYKHFEFQDYLFKRMYCERDSAMNKNWVSHATHVLNSNPKAIWINSVLNLMWFMDLRHSILSLYLLQCNLICTKIWSK